MTKNRETYPHMCNMKAARAMMCMYVNASSIKPLTDHTIKMKETKIFQADVISMHTKQTPSIHSVSIQFSQGKSTRSINHEPTASFQCTVIWTRKPYHCEQSNQQMLMAKLMRMQSSVWSVVCLKLVISDACKARKYKCSSCGHTHLNERRFTRESWGENRVKLLCEWEI